MRLGITEQFRDNWVLLQINGEIDMATGPELRQRIVQYVQEVMFILLLTLLKLTLLIPQVWACYRWLKTYRSHGGDLQCIGLSESLKEMFKLTGLDASSPRKIHELKSMAKKL